MQVQAFSCARPLPEHMDRMCVPASSTELDALIAEDAYTQDLGRCLYLVARRDGELVRRGIVCCGDVDELSKMAAPKAGTLAATSEGASDTTATANPEAETPQQDGNSPQVSDPACENGLTDAAQGDAPARGELPDADAAGGSALEKARELGAHAEAFVCEYEASYALDVIVAAAQSATPLYNLSNGSDTQVVVWRVSREDAVQAICAVLATVECKPVAGSSSAIVAAKVLADEAREKRPNLDERSAVLHPLCLLVPAGQDTSAPLLPSDGLLMHRFA